MEFVFSNSINSASSFKSSTTFSGNGDSGEVDIALESSQEEIQELSVKQDSTGTYSLEYLNPIIKAVGNSVDVVTCEYSSAKRSIELERSPRVTRLYPAGIGQNQAKICKFLTIDSQRKIMMFLLDKEVATSVEIRNFIKKSPSVVSVNLSQLFKEKIINKQYE